MPPPAPSEAHRPPRRSPAVAGALPTGGGAPHWAAQGAAAAALQQQQTQQQPTGGVPPDVLEYMLQADPGNMVSADGSKLPGARGAASMEYLRRDLPSRPKAWSQTIRRNAALALAGDEDDSDPRTHSIWEFMRQTGAANRSNRAVAYMTFAVSKSLDLMRQGRYDLAEAYFLLLMCATEQSARDSGRWGLAWLLTHLPEPPWGTMQQSVPQNDLRPFGFLAEPTWTTAAMSYTKDTVALAEVRRKFTDDQSKSGDDRKQPDKKGDKGEAKGDKK